MLRDARAWFFARRVFRETFDKLPNGQPNVSGRMALAHLRRLCYGEPGQTVFDADPLIMAAKASKLEIYKEIERYLTITNVEINAIALQTAEGSDDQ